MKTNDDPRIGVFVCHCGLNIAGVLDCEELADKAGELPDVVYSGTHRYICSDDGVKMIQEKIEEHDLKRVVVASCTPRTHEPIFRETCEKAGLNPYIFEMTNIRDQCSWVHAHQPRDEVMRKATEQIEMSIERAKLLEPQPKIKVPVGDKALVIGGGIAGINAALNLADSGFEVYLVERRPSIGGRMAQLDKTFPTMDCSICIEGPKMVEVDRHPNIEILSYAEVREIEGWIGNYTVKIEKKPRYVTEDCNACGECEKVCPVYLPDEFQAGLDVRKAIYQYFAQAVPSTYVIDKEKCIDCGLCVDVCEDEQDAIDLDMEPEEIEFKVDTIVVTTGCDLYDPSKKDDYGYSSYDNVMTQMELERLVCAGGPTEGEVIRRSDHEEPKRVAFIQCVGSRDETGGVKYCCKVGCSNTLKQCFLLNEHIPDVEIDVFYIDIRNVDEDFYGRIRDELGVKFIRARPFEVKEDPETKNLRVKSEHTTLGRVMEKEYDMVVLVTGVVPSEGAKIIDEASALSRDEYGFFVPVHPKLRPVETALDGIAIAGMCQEPMDIHTTVGQARGAAGSLIWPMVQHEFAVESITSTVDEEECRACGICEDVCPYGAIKVEEIGETPAKVVEASCKGCGTCSAECPRDAITMRHFSDAQILAQLRKALEKNPEEKVLCFLCNWCAYAGADFAGVSRIEYPPSSRHIRVMCSGRVDPDFILEAFKVGANQVLIGGCHIPSDCHYISGNLRCEERVEKLKKKLKRKGINPDRLRLEWISATEGKKFANTIKEMHKMIPEFREEAVQGSAE